MGKASRRRRRAAAEERGPRGGMDFRLITAVVLVLGVGGFAVSRIASLKNQVLNQASKQVSGAHEDYAAPEFRGVTTWINSPPLTLRSLRGKVVLVDFWTYSCVNCIRTLPFLKAFYARYHAFGLQVVGVHTPEFDFEKVPSNVRGAVRDHGVVWPVAMDNDMATWNAYGNQYWPHVYLLDRRGHVRDDFIGEGSDAAIETAIRQLLAGPGVTLPATAPLPSVDLSADMTPEIYLGYGAGRIRRSLGNREGYTTNIMHDYAAPTAVEVNGLGPSGAFFLAGRWLARSDDVVSGGGGARVILDFHARDVYVVGGAAAAGTVAYRVLLDGRPIASADAGPDLQGGRVAMGMRDLYHVVHLREAETHVLTLVAQGPGVEQFTFTFG